MKTHVLLILTMFASLFAVSFAPAYAAVPAEVSAKAMEGYRLFVRDSLPDDRAKGYAMMAEAAWEGDPKAANNLGWILQHGLGGETDLPGALRWYERAADQKLPAAALNYADLIFSHPEVLEERLPDRRRLAAAAMLAGSALAMGRGLPFDYGRGEDLIFRAALLGDDAAAMTVAQQLEMYPDSFSRLPIAEIVEQCDAILPPDARNLPPGADPATFAETLLTPGFWYARTDRRALP